MNKKAIREFLMSYAWVEETEAKKALVVDCIMAQDGWKYHETVADVYAGAQAEPGPHAFSEGLTYALSALYECHDSPHLPTCPHNDWEK